MRPAAAGQRAGEGGTPLVAPDLIIAEVYNGAWRCARAGRITQAQVERIASALPGLLAALVGGADLAVRAVALAGQLDRPAYDCVYIALAAARQLDLVTADAKLLAGVHDTAWAPQTRNLADYHRA